MPNSVFRLKHKITNNLALQYDRKSIEYLKETIKDAAFADIKTFYI